MPPRPALTALTLFAALVAWLPAGAASTAAASSAPNTAAPGARIFKLALAGSENGFDPAQVSDVTSASLVGSLFDAPLTYDFLARPMKLKPRTAEALPEVNAAHTHFVIRLRRGIRFPDDPAFKGQPRELTAADYVYSIKRYYDPATRSPTLFHYQNAGLIGLSELRTRAIETQTPFPYDQEVEGLRVVDRYTFEIRTARPAPRLPYVLATPALAGAVAREVVEGNPARAMEHPVGTGPYRLASWKRRSLIVL
ncbi:MAG: bicyclomycin resistance protein, partial [Rubrivivax sp.]|nr:bicyclomycin resistance protein [Rubrivivax sp.]